MAFPIVVVCRRPGLIRGGMHNPAVATYDARALTVAQLTELVAEPEITVLRGHVVTAHNLPLLLDMRQAVLDATQAATAAADPDALPGSDGGDVAEGDATVEGTGEGALPGPVDLGPQDPGAAAPVASPARANRGRRA